jgi:RNA exonuclease 4
MPRYVALDVECVATGSGHSERIPATVALVSKDGRTLQDDAILVDNVYSYLTPLTGLSRDDFKHARPLSEVLADTYSILGPDVILVGQHPESDIKWLQLIKGVHFNYAVDIAHFFKKFNNRYNKYTFRSLQHTAQVLLSEDMTGSHLAYADAMASMKLYCMYMGADDSERKTMVDKVHVGRPATSVAKRYGYSIDGVCLAGFNSRYCTCSDPILS